MYDGGKFVEKVLHEAVYKEGGVKPLISFSAAALCRKGDIVAASHLYAELLYIFEVYDVDAEKITAQDNTCVIISASRIVRDEGLRRTFSYGIFRISFEPRVDYPEEYNKYISMPTV